MSLWQKRLLLPPHHYTSTAKAAPYILTATTPSGRPASATAVCRKTAPSPGRYRQTRGCLLLPCTMTRILHGTQWQFLRTVLQAAQRCTSKQRAIIIPLRSTSAARPLHSLRSAREPRRCISLQSDRRKQHESKP